MTDTAEHHRKIDANALMATESELGIANSVVVTCQFHIAGIKSCPKSFNKKMIYKECDNKSNCHDPHIITEDESAMRVMCRICKYRYIIRKDPSKKVPLNKQYIKVFKRFSLQGNTNLFYKYYPQYLGR